MPMCEESAFEIVTCFLILPPFWNDDVILTPSKLGDGSSIEEPLFSLNQANVPSVPSHAYVRLDPVNILLAANGMILISGFPEKNKERAKYIKDQKLLMFLICRIFMTELILATML